ncbi:VOC family protein [Klebsiella pneumoniae]|uniref:VOC family protein n=1 Tax=Klebsiella pneumoniae TaxID=573 RepID=UPI002358EA75|nr:VOC family protein [Klebsiella pneumoniae]WCZ30125.1 VOC family protein [Klebsiella pneumoniae]
MDNYTLHRGRLIDHIQLVINDFAASKAFYTAVLAELKIPMVITDDDYIWADELVISSVKSSESGGGPTGRHHLAFQAADRESVNAFYHAALNHGGRDNGAPAERTYLPGYYAAFVLDPDGNNIEAVYHGEGDRSARSVEISFTV